MLCSTNAYYNLDAWNYICTICFPLWNSSNHFNAYTEHQAACPFLSSTKFCIRLSLVPYPMCNQDVNGYIWVLFDGVFCKTTSIKIKSQYNAFQYSIMFQSNTGAVQFTWLDMYIKIRNFASQVSNVYRIRLACVQ